MLNNNNNICFLSGCYFCWAQGADYNREEKSSGKSLIWNRACCILRLLTLDFWVKLAMCRTNDNASLVRCNTETHQLQNFIRMIIFPGLTFFWRPFFRCELKKVFGKFPKTYINIFYKYPLENEEGRKERKKMNFWWVKRGWRLE